MTLIVSPGRVAADANAIVTFRGPAGVAVEWSVSVGSIAAQSPATNAGGVATAIFSPDGAPAGTVATITVTHGTT